MVIALAAMFVLFRDGVFMIMIGNKSLSFFGRLERLPCYKGCPPKQIVPNKITLYLYLISIFLIS